MITEHCVNKIKSAAQLQNVVGELVTLKRSGANLVGTCPFCDKEKKFTVSKAKDLWKCFSCDRGGNGSVSFIMQVKTNGDYINALKYLAEKYNISIDYEQQSLPFTPGPKAPKKASAKKAEKKITFRDQQLILSGLTEEDQKYKKQLPDAGKDDYIEMDRYQAGTRNEKWEIITGDDMVMHYMDLEGGPMMYHKSGTSKDYPLVRIRWAHPELHKDKDDRPMKYQSPFNSGSRLWINQVLRNKYKNRTKIDTLFIQEGEKKADKATKHGLTSVGIMGIHNIANNKQLPHEFELIIKQCDVQNVVFIVDSDFLDIGDSITSPVNQRPQSFLYAIINFRKYFYALNNSGISLNIYFGYIRSEHNQKGIDDLLVNTLKDKEHLLLEDVKSAMIDTKGEGAHKYINCHNITSYNEFKIKAEFFHMETWEKFAEFHKEKLKERKVFTIGREVFKFSTAEEFPDKLPGTLVLAQPLSHEEQFWDEAWKKRSDGTELITTFKYVECCRFLENKKFGRYAVGEDGEFNFIKVDDNVVRVVKFSQIKDYLMEFTRNALQKKNVLEMLYRGAKQYLSDNVNNLDYIKLKFHKADKGLQYMYFNKTFWKITSEGVEEKPILELDGHVWKEKIKDFTTTVQKPFFKVIKDTEGKYLLEFPEGLAKAKECVFFNYLMNTSNFHWRATHEGILKVKPAVTDKRMLTDLEIEDLRMHFISKITAFGYLLHEHFNANVAKAVVAMDGKLSEVNASNGRSGKSLFGKALSKLVPTVTLPGKQKDLTEDKFLLDGVTERTRIVNIDDVRVNFDFEHFFSMIGGAWKVNPKGAKSFELQQETSPKIFITTNHALNGEGGSFKARQCLLAFSDYYNEDYQPVDEHGHLFFDEWDRDEWIRFYNLAAYSLVTYFQHGLIAAPMDRLEQRRLRQAMGEKFVEWAENYYDPETINESDGTNNLGVARDRNELLESFYKSFPEEKSNRYMDTRKFKQCIIKYCYYKDFLFNPKHPDKANGKEYGGRDKRNNIEYFTVEPKIRMPENGKTTYVHPF